MDSDFLMFQKLLNETTQEKDVFARFYDRPVKTDKIGKNGMPVIENRTFVEIKMTNNTTEVYDQPATEDKVRRFPVEYQRYKLAQKQSAEGTPLEMFAFLDAAEIESLKMRGIFTVEALAALGKETAEKLDIAEQQNRAEKFLAVSKNNSVIDEFAKKETEYKAEIENLQAQIAELKKKIKE